ncbi:hypothetical protein GUITHDRAFT_103916 [Guillardia theta CCMP2712]|uniref:Rubisco LSMT substrate-binding domain-containing protein n=2 Tax=Guillardia theta TaxID=55529 RepID=L1JPV1_GUITC|nr:hypothetical protein GUITHDRAFT_103916 [Guillardia theta CCMP2712]EKX50103.1 hypothetical protein GUITHDRAFT_103916 [Guillardia theta CCMP2712]|eukprot:XP_005837083.1 hypothetical protein GUITHDRAFT_103916 [Guillardia theta CCMP2712]
MAAMATPGRLTLMLVLLSSGGGGHAWTSVVHRTKRAPCHAAMCDMKMQQQQQQQQQQQIQSMLDVVEQYPSVSFSPLLDFSPSLRSFVRTGKTGRGEELATIPQRHCLQTDIGRDLRSSHVDLAVKLANEGMELEGVVAHAPDLPYTWSQQEIAELQWPDIQRRLEEEKVWMEEKLADPAVSTIPRATMEPCFAMARSFSYVAAGKLYFAPVLALFQRTAPKGSRVEGRGERLVLTSDEGEEGEQVRVSLGWISNDDVLCHHGCAYESLESDAILLSRAQVDLALSSFFSSTPQHLKVKQDEVMAALRRYSYISEEEQEDYAIFPGGYASDGLGMLLQAKCLLDEELEAFKVQGCALNIGETVPFSRDHETRVGHALIELCQQLLSSCPTSLQEDAKTLKAMGERSETQEERRRRICVVYRMSRKNYLHQTLDRCYQWVKNPTATGTLRRPWKVNIKTSG